MKNLNYNLRFFFQNINNVLFNNPLNLKMQLLNEKMKKNAFECESCTFK